MKRIVMLLTCTLSLSNLSMVFASETTGEFINRIYHTQIVAGDKTALMNNLNYLEQKLKEASFVENYNHIVEENNNSKDALVTEQKNRKTVISNTFNQLSSNYYDSLKTVDLDLVVNARSKLRSFLVTNEIDIDVGVSVNYNLYNDSKINYNGNSSILIEKEISSVVSKINNLEGDINYGEIPTKYPVTGKITSSFGIRVDPINGSKSFHSGQDIASPSGTKIPAWFNGTVTESSFNEGNGNYVVVKQGALSIYYLHMSERLVSVGDVIKQGDILGKVGSTGRSTGPHLHLTMKINNIAVDPSKIITSQGSG